MRKMKMFAWCAVAALAAISTQAQATAVTVNVGDSTASWNGYMNWTHQYPAPNPDLNGGGSWGIADLTAVFDDSAPNVTLGPNTIDAAADDAYWWIPGAPPLGTKDMEANLYIEETGPLAGQTVTFEGNVDSFGFSLDYVARAFISDFAPDYSSRVDTFLPISAAGPFSFSLTTINDPSRHVQYGFQVVGRNIFPTDEAGIATAGNMVIGTVPEPTSIALFGLAGLALASMRRRR